jgi:hypothetical protein
MALLLGDGLIPVNAAARTIADRILAIWHRVVFVRAFDASPGATSRQALGGEPSAPPQPMPGNGLIGIFRTGWHEPAGISDKA